VYFVHTVTKVVGGVFVRFRAPLHQQHTDPSGQGRDFHDLFHLQLRPRHAALVERERKFMQNQCDQRRMMPPAVYVTAAAGNINVIVIRVMMKPGRQNEREWGSRY
jgi:hypothetical protein